MDCTTVLKRASSIANIQLHRSGFNPGSAERDAIQISTTEIHERMLSIDSEIQKLTRLRGQSSSQLELNQSLVAPVRRLPSEILSKIFVYHARLSPSLAEQTLYTTCTVAHVCCAWRAAARGTLQLWTPISSTAPFPGCSIASGDVFEAQLELSGVLPVQLSHTVHDDLILERFLAVLGPHSSRWQPVTLRGSCNLLRSLPKYYLPQLEEVSITLEGQNTDDVVDFLSGATVLKRLAVAFHWRNNPDPSLFTEFPDFVSLPSHTSPLHSTLFCDWMFLSMSDDPDWNTVSHLSGRQRANMSALSTLEVGQGCFEVFDMIDAPALEEIVVRDVRGHHRADLTFQLLASFSEHMGHPGTLRRLTLRNIECQEWMGNHEDFLHCIWRWRGLKELHVEEPADCTPILAPDAIEWLAGEAVGPLYLPNLVSF
ncbi:uncharacterized protein SCHCODRAFT_02548994 [Schizophyllum commune H4-8]|nr:uncharacterized protein SCHCODRAFT_02548994 [Schizophyllum commune H4-8]KAI5889223.1 hypothetical protein SCHCODRAFT_02548994 [Schizophyllum commune H4-8]